LGGRGWHLATALLLLGLAVFLGVRAADEDRWSDWGFGDAQTMLSLRHWEEGGWLNNYLLFIPQGYAKAVRHLDEPDLRQHAHGTCPSASPRVGPRLWYTHYPPGYLIPYAAAFRVGLDTMPAVRMVAVAFSLAALVLLYALFGTLTDRGTAFLAVAFYGLSPVFLGFADSLANQPIDDLLRFAFMLAVVVSTRAEPASRRRTWTQAAWGIEFALSLCSFDSVFFLYAWLVAWDWLDGRGFRWRRYLLFALAPVTAHGLQFLQNVWYLGLDAAAIDVADTFLLKTGAEDASRLALTWDAIRINLASAFWRTDLFLALAGLYAVRVGWLRGPDEARLPSLRLLAVLLACGVAYALVLPHGARMPYQGRQVLPFVALLAAGLTMATLRSFRRLAGGEAPGARRLELPWLLAAVCGVFLLGVFLASAPRKPTYDLWRFGPDLELARALQTLPTQREPIFFDLDGFRTFWDPTYVPGYPQILPLLEYYAGSRPILCFTAEEGLVEDLKRLLARSDAGFSPVLVSSDRARLKGLAGQLRDEGVLASMPVGAFPVFGRHVVDLTPHLQDAR
jgi:hypothetical protein